MVKYFRQLLQLFCLLTCCVSGLLFAQSSEVNAMFNKHIQQPSTIVKNLKGIEFNERSTVEGIVDDLAREVKDPYAASLPLITSAELGDEKRYAAAHFEMLKTLDILEKKPDECPEWMRNESFKAWMWGRVLLAADSIGNVNDVKEAKEKLTGLLRKPMTEKDSLAFYAWAWGYRAALNTAEYKASEIHMMSDAKQLREIYQKDTKNHDALSNAMWSNVMNITASANEAKQYEAIKHDIQALGGENTVTASLEKSLLRTAASNDYPAWALAKVRYAAALRGDRELYLEMDSALQASLEAANKAGAKAEYALGVVDGQLALIAGRQLSVGLQVRKQ